MTKHELKGTNQVDRRLEIFLHEQIASGALQEGDRLLSERAIGKMFNVSGVAVHNAMRRFIDRGILEKIPRKGTYIKRLPGKRTVTNRLGVLYCHGGGSRSIFMDPFYSAIFAGIDLQAQAMNKRIEFSYLLAGSGVTPGGVLTAALEDADGIMLVDPFPRIYQELEPMLLEIRKPLVLVNYEGGSGDLDAVCVESRENARKMTGMLIQQGHRRVACAYHLPTDHGSLHPNYTNRIAGYRDALVDHGIPFDQGLVFDLERTRFNEILKCDGRPTAVFCAGDMLALKVYEAAREAGIRIPDDLSVTGHDDVHSGVNAVPPLTTVHTPLMELGALAVKRIMERTRERTHGGTPRYKTVLPGRIVLRNSHRKIF